MARASGGQDRRPRRSSSANGTRLRVEMIELDFAADGDEVGADRSRERRQQPQAAEHQYHRHQLDIGGSRSTIGRVGREDRAMLRSNPSAAADAGRGTWGGSWTVCTSRPRRGEHPGRKAINLGVWGRAPAPPQPTGVPYGKILRGFCPLLPGYPRFRPDGLHRGLRSGAPTATGAEGRKRTTSWLETGVRLCPTYSCGAMGLQRIAR